jgi:hypothetical protein
MPPDLEACLAAALAAPADDAPRHALAQLYRTAGDPFGEYIELQLRSAPLPIWHPERPELNRRARQLYKQYGPEWARAFGAEGLHLRFRRGLPHSVVGTPTELRAELEAVARRAPIEALDLEIDEEETGPDWDLEHLVDLEAFKRLRCLRLSETYVRPAALARVLSHPVWQGLEVLELGIDACETEAIVALAPAALPVTLRELRCGGYMSGMGDEGLGALSLSPWLGQLTCLGLSGQGLTDAGLEALAASPADLRLRELCLDSSGYSTNRITADGLRALADRPWFTGLRQLDLHGCAVA